ncbi:hypothetical protein SLEP1_g24848 [Rubroshorea leprosula]|uniref:Uncharacterized protein n=1 Tax=Rubroshorea leprosula TaxID=152421 RepID=A0AAV5JU88_9ROSI|nr:hypothetical protein SLEP1_g24848 [Rubroshorea leprosula]
MEVTNIVVVFCNDKMFIFIFLTSSSNALMLVVVLKHDLHV